jgi:hypothetical protein
MFLIWFEVLYRDFLGHSEKTTKSFILIRLLFENLTRDLRNMKHLS